MAIANFRNRSTSGFDQDALTTTTDGEYVFNSGRLTTTGDLADGIFYGADNVTIRNFAWVETSGLGAAGIPELRKRAIGEIRLNVARRF